MSIKNETDRTEQSNRAESKVRALVRLAMWNSERQEGETAMRQAQRIAAEHGIDLEEIILEVSSNQTPRASAPAQKPSPKARAKRRPHEPAPKQQHKASTGEAQSFALALASTIPHFAEISAWLWSNLSRGMTCIKLAAHASKLTGLPIEPPLISFMVKVGCFNGQETLRVYPGRGIALA